MITDVFKQRTMISVRCKDCGREVTTTSGSCGCPNMVMVKGDTVTSSTKTVTCETGLEVVVPMFIEEGEIIKIDTKDNSYMTRV